MGVMSHERGAHERGHRWEGYHMRGISHERDVT